MVASILSQLDLPDFIAANSKDYVTSAVRAAGSTEQLAGLRSTLRQRIRDSALLDANRFTRQLEEAYRKMWQQAQY
jgi:predicted O-linked N-acetylglucosamine transferase (SPINDLY family)